MRRLVLLPLLLFVSLPLFAATADLGINAISNTPPPALDPGSTFTLRFQVFSLGPEPAEHPRLAVAVPQEWQLMSAESQLGTCIQTGSTITCESSQPLTTVGRVEVALTMRLPPDRSGGTQTITGTISSDATDPKPENNSAIVTLTINRLIVVESDADDGSGSLRQAIATMNAGCGADLPCKITFDHPMTIEPASPLPAVTVANATIDGGDVVNNTCRVTLRGTKQPSGNGLDIRLALGKYVGPLTIHGLAVMSFPGNGIDFADAPAVGSLAPTASVLQCQITGNKFRGISTGAGHLFLTVAQDVISGNERSGVALWSIASAYMYQNVIESNGASGVFAGYGFAALYDNRIATNHEYGISSAFGSLMHSANVIRDNGAQPIDISLDGPSRGGSVQPPQITDAFYDAAMNRTVIRGHLAGTTGQNQETFHIHFAAADAPNEHGYVDPQTQLNGGATLIPAMKTFDVPFEATFVGDLRGQLVIGYTSWAPFPDLLDVNASELSDAVRVH